jgi:hypothetical protein
VLTWTFFTKDNNIGARLQLGTKFFESEQPDEFNWWKKDAKLFLAESIMFGERSKMLLFGRGGAQPLA